MNIEEIFNNRDEYVFKYQWSDDWAPIRKNWNPNISDWKFVSNDNKIIIFLYALYEDKTNATIQFKLKPAVEFKKKLKTL